MKKVIFLRIHIFSKPSTPAASFSILYCHSLMRFKLIYSNNSLNFLSSISFCHSIWSFYFVQHDKYGVQPKPDLSFEYVNAGVCLWGENCKGWRGSVSVLYSWFQGEFDSFSSVTLKVSFSAPGFYQHTLQAASPRKKKEGRKEKATKLCKWKHLGRDKNDISSVHRLRLMLYGTLL